MGMRVFKLVWWSMLIASVTFGASGTVSRAPRTAASTNLPLSEYLNEVKSKNYFYQGAQQKREGAAKRQSEADLATSPYFFASGYARNDGKLPALPLFTYEQVESQNYAFGFTQATSFGLQAKLAYEIDFTRYVNSSLEPTARAQGIPLTFYDARPVLELSQPLWQNGFGGNIQAMQEMVREQSKAEHFAAEAEGSTLLVQAEAAYWRLAVAQEVVAIQEAALKQAQAIFNYVADKGKMNLGDKADTLQAKALFEMRKLELKSAQDEARLALRTFNSFRNAAAAGDDLALEPIPWDKIETRKAPELSPMRADVKASEAQSKAAAANARLQEEKDKPTLDLVGSLALNGRNKELGKAFSSSYKDDRPTYAVGVRFSMPLEFGALTEAREGAVQMQKASELQYRQKLEDQKVNWEDLVTRIQDSQERLKLAKEIEEAQKTKLDYERTRLRQGRTTTYQVLMFEQDFLQAELGRTRSVAELLNLFAQVRLYESASSSSASDGVK